MLALPTRGMARSVTVHNVDLDVLVDWIEGSILFADDQEISKTQIVDILCEAHVYATQALAWGIVGDSWTELRRRMASMEAGYPIEIGDDAVTHNIAWRDTPAYGFCLALSFAKWYPSWAKQFGRDFTDQGEMFELLTKESLQVLFPGWNLHLTGWARTRAARLKSVVGQVAGLLGETIGRVDRWTRASANEAGLDLLCYRPFPDGRVGVPVYLLQCASGGDWEGKLHTPHLDTWTKIVEFAAKPRKAFATPFCFLDKDFIIHCGVVNGLLLDRYRLLSAVRTKADWLPADLGARMIAWLEPRIAQLPQAAQVL